MEPDNYGDPRGWAKVTLSLFLLLSLRHTGRTLHRYQSGFAASESGVTSPELLIMFPYGYLERF